MDAGPYDSPLGRSRPARLARVYYCGSDGAAGGRAWINLASSGLHDYATSRKRAYESVLCTLDAQAGTTMTAIVHGSIVAELTFIC